ncbi:probable (S)-N-methylcoclaurine 3'-hydroxylase isozyme 2 [Diospyros lotus]|uniref:probable (S)-N-methylcoclaurine 3'-hydroxylase isozyme 2 n=1 Tax=Diospyros lotus TaxID=55363 RepID=UPI0022529791|nr:probable (S)-N-methylcoclaurine 3'-hydroxylase isozyme 2 [Diospyros lotus]
MNFAPLSHAMQSWANSDIYALLYPLFLLLLLLLLLILKKHIQSPPSRGQTLPPGPRPWPILGNAMEIGFKPHVSLSNLARVHGPLISLRLGSQLLVVASSPAAATEVLKSQDRLLSGRCAPQAFPISASVLERSSFIWAPECTERWKLLRALCRNELLSAKVLETGAALRERKTAEVVEFLGEKEGKVMEIGEVVHTLVSNVLSNLCFSKDFIDLRGGVGREFKEIVSAMKKLVITPNVADLYPGLLGKLDPQGLRGRPWNAIED